MISVLKNIFYKMIGLITKKEYIIDVTGIVLTPGDKDGKCKGNGNHKNLWGKEIECCCDECDYLMWCVEGKGQKL